MRRIKSLEKRVSYKFTFTTPVVYVCRHHIGQNCLVRGYIRAIRCLNSITARRYLKQMLVKTRLNVKDCASACDWHYLPIQWSIVPIIIIIRNGVLDSLHIAMGFADDSMIDEEVLDETKLVSSTAHLPTLKWLNRFHIIKNTQEQIKLYFLAKLHSYYLHLNVVVNNGEKFTSSILFPCRYGKVSSNLGTFLLTIICGSQGRRRFWLKCTQKIFNAIPDHVGFPVVFLAFLFFKMGIFKNIILKREIWW